MGVFQVQGEVIRGRTEVVEDEIELLILDAGGGLLGTNVVHDRCSIAEVARCGEEEVLVVRVTE